MPNPQALDPAWIGVIGTIFGGLGVKSIEYFLSRSRVRIDDATQIREELRIEVTALREEIKDLEDERDKWRAEYYDLRDKYVQMQTELTLALQKIKAESPIPDAPPPLPPISKPAVDSPEQL